MRIRALTRHTCEKCNATFESIRTDARYCSDECSKQARAEKQKEYFNTKYYPENKEKIISRTLENRKKK